jgi:hypothetical protein
VCMYVCMCVEVVVLYRSEIKPRGDQRRAVGYTPIILHSCTFEQTIRMSRLNTMCRRFAFRGER